MRSAITLGCLAVAVCACVSSPKPAQVSDTSVASDPGASEPDLVVTPDPGMDEPDSGFLVDLGEMEEVVDVPPDPLTPDQLLVGACDKILGVPPANALDDDVILIGALLPRTGQLAPEGIAAEQAVDMAFDEINKTMGLFGHKFAVLSCDTGTDLTQALMAADHLVNVAKVPAIIGAMSSDVSIGVFTECAQEAGVLMLSPYATAGLMASLPDDGLLWSTAPSNSQQGIAVAHYLLEQAYSKVAVINRSDAWGSSLRTAMEAVLCAEGGLDCMNNYMGRAYDDATIMQDMSDAVVDFAGFQPEVIVVLSYFEDGIGFVNAAEGGAGFTQFVFGDGDLRDPIVFTPEIGVDLEVLCRAFGVANAGPIGVLFQSFQLRWSAFTGGMDLQSYTAHAYDAAYVMAYAIAAAKGHQQPLTGTLVAMGMQRLSAGPIIEIGAANWNTAIQILASAPDTTIDLVGASGGLDFDPDAGDAIGQPVEGWHFNGTLQSCEELGVVLDADGVYHGPDYSGVADDPVCDALLNP